MIRVQGEHELQRTLAALWWSAVAAGLTIGLSLMGMGLFRAALPEQEWAIIVSSFGYPMGFLAVILARQQLFTENTLTAVLPVMTEPTLEKAWQLLRLWSVVLFGISSVRCCSPGRCCICRYSMKRPTRRSLRSAAR